MNGSPYQLKADPYSSHAVILSRLGEGRGRRALDVGAADGFLAELLTRQGWQVTALERDPAQAAKARGRCHEVIVADLDGAAPRLQGVFDAIVYGDVVEHLSDPLPVVVALDRSLAGDGRVIVSVPNVAHVWVRLSLALGRWNYADRGILDRTHLRFFTKRSFLAFLRDAGLDVEELVATPVPLPLVVPPRLHGTVLDAVHGVSAAAARAWKGGLAYQLVEALGTVARGPALEAAGRLTRTDREALRRCGVRIGFATLYLPGLLKPAAVRLRALLWATWSSAAPCSPPRPGLNSVRTEPETPLEFYEAVGYPVVAGRAVRADILERIDGALRQAARRGAAAPLAQVIERGSPPSARSRRWRWKPIASSTHRATEAEASPTRAAPANSRNGLPPLCPASQETTANNSAPDHRPTASSGSLPAPALGMNTRNSRAIRVTPHQP